MDSILLLSPIILSHQTCGSIYSSRLTLFCIYRLRLHLFFIHHSPHYHLFGAKRSDARAFSMHASSKQLFDSTHAHAQTQRRPPSHVASIYDIITLSITHASYRIYLLGSRVFGREKGTHQISF